MKKTNKLIVAGWILLLAICFSQQVQAADW